VSEREAILKHVISKYSKMLLLLFMGFYGFGG
jgi:hypothetical protein